MRSRWTTGGDSCTAWQQNCGDACSKEEPGKGKPVKAEEERSRKSRFSIQCRDKDRNKVGKLPEEVPRKAAIVCLVPVP